MIWVDSAGWCSGRVVYCKSPINDNIIDDLVPDLTLPFVCKILMGILISLSDATCFKSTGRFAWISCNQALWYISIHAHHLDCLCLFALFRQGSQMLVLHYYSVVNWMRCSGMISFWVTISQWHVQMQKGLSGLSSKISTDNIEQIIWMNQPTGTYMYMSVYCTDHMK